MKIQSSYGGMIEMNDNFTGCHNDVKPDIKSLLVVKLNVGLLNPEDAKSKQADFENQWATLFNDLRMIGVVSMIIPVRAHDTAIELLKLT